MIDRVTDSSGVAVVAQVTAHGTGLFTGGSASNPRMPIVEVSLPKRIDAELDRLVEEDEFLNREQAIEALLTDGLMVYESPDETPEEMTDDVFTQAVDDQQDPALEDDR